MLLSTLAGCGDGGGAAPEDTSTTAASPAQDDAVRARRLVVRITDLPAGWTSRPHQRTPEDEQVERELRACLGGGQIPTRTAEADSDDFANAGSQVTSRAVVAPTVEQARREHDRAATPEFSRCLTEVFRRRFQRSPPEGAALQDLRADRLSVPPVADGLVAHRLTITLSAPQGNAVFYADLFVMRSERTSVSVNFVNPGSPFPADVERSVMDRLANRAKA